MWFEIIWANAWKDSKHVIISQTIGFKTLAGFELASNMVYITINYKEILDSSDLLLLLLHFFFTKDMQTQGEKKKLIHMEAFTLYLCTNLIKDGGHCDIVKDSLASTYAKQNVR